MIMDDDNGTPSAALAGGFLKADAETFWSNCNTVMRPVETLRVGLGDASRLGGVKNSGARVGAREGRLVGLGRGARVGAADTLGSNDVDGAPEGTIDGSLEGSIVGVSIGASVGAFEDDGNIVTGANVGWFEQLNDEAMGHKLPSRQY